MKPIAEQQQSIKTLLRSILKYKETYDEVYDHILSSLEGLPTDANFAHTIRDIVENELGGARGLKTLERKLFISSIRGFIKDYFINIKESFTSVLMVPIALCTWLFYRAIISGRLDQEGASAIIIHMTLDVCILIMFLFNYKKWRSKQHSIPGIISVRRTLLKFSSTLLFIPFILWAKTHAFYANHDIPVKVLTALFLIAVVHIISCFKLFMNKKNFQYTT
ncbi:hypothetical protein ACFS5N_15520 [Mucilaginibacter ximonensis]|uniref:Uncharacterized protein n=1 Tax=Mucilaginibacter ximonensis TaxID=538021 RepID=A0ABW5YG36_9SPHI